VVRTQLILSAVAAAVVAGCAVNPGPNPPADKTRKPTTAKAADKKKAAPPPKDDGSTDPDASKGKSEKSDPAQDKSVHARPPIKFDLSKAMKLLGRRHEKMEALLAENDGAKALTELNAMETTLVQAQLQTERGEKFSRLAAAGADQVAAVGRLVREGRWGEAQKRYEHVHAACAACHGVFRKE
jgi:hypothetical protein